MIDPNTNMQCPTCNKILGASVLDCENCLDFCNRLRVCTGQECTDWQESQRKAIDRVTELMHVHNMPLDEVFRFMKVLEGMATAASLLYRNMTVKERIPNPKAAQAKAKEFREAIERQKSAQQPKKEKRLLSDRERLFESLKKQVGKVLDDKAIWAMVDTQLVQAGRSDSKIGYVD